MGELGPQRSLHQLHAIEDTRKVMGLLASGDARHTIVVVAGYIRLEITERCAAAASR